jgi:hypothetical protein
MKTGRQIVQRVMLAAIALLGTKLNAQTAPDAQPVPPPAASAPLSDAELQQLVAPIALYPDPLVAVILPAAAYPVEIVQAARFVKDPDNLAALDQQPWDTNVKTVARMPSVIQMLDTNLDWTVRLGNAFVNQQLGVMNAIQALRAQAQAAGTLQTTSQQIVIQTNAVVERYYDTQIVYVTNSAIEIQPADPDVVYVPVYNPAVVYVTSPAYVYNPVAPVVTFGVGIAIGAIIANNRCDWYYGGVYYGRSGFVVWGGTGHYHPPYYPPPPGCRPPPYYPPPGYRPPPPGYRPPGYPPPGSRPPVATPYPGQRPTGPGASQLPANSQRWQPDQSRRQNSSMPGSSAGVGSRETRGWGGSAGTTGAYRPPGAGATGYRPPTTGYTPYTTPANRPAPQPAPSYNRAVSGAGYSQPAAPGQTYNRPAQSNAGQNSAFGNMNNGAAARASSNRGAVSRGGGMRGGGRR